MLVSSTFYIITARWGLVVVVVVVVVPAPVVPPALDEDSNVGDCWMV